MKYWHNIIFTFFCFCVAFSAVNSSAAPLLRALTPDQGLSQGSIRDLLIDKEGYLWLATDAGINRYDSNQVLQISTAQYPLNEMAFSAVLQDSEQRIWAASATNGIYLFKPELGQLELAIPMSAFTGIEQLPLIISLSEYDKDHLLVSVSDSLFLVSTNLTDLVVKPLFSLTKLGMPNGWLRTALVLDNNVFIATFNGLYYLDLNTGLATHLPHLTPDMLHDTPNRQLDQKHIKYLQLHQQRLWLGAVDGLYSISVQDIKSYIETKQTYTPIHHINDYNIWQIIWQDDFALIATDRGLLTFNPVKNTYKKILRLTDSPLGLFDDNILDIAADEYGGYWLATRNDGAYYWHHRGQAFSHVSKQANNGYSLSNEKVYSLAPASDNAVWVGTSNGLNHVELKSKIVTQYLINDDVKTIFHSSTIGKIIPIDKEKMWIVTSEGLNVFNLPLNQVSAAPSNSPEDSKILSQARRFFYSYKNFIYFATSDNFYRYNQTTNELLAQPELTAAINPANFGAILGEIKNGQQLLLSDADQLWTYDLKQQKLDLVYQHQPYQPQLGRTATTMQLDDNNVLWIGFIGLGILGFDGNNLDLLHSPTKLSDSKIAYDLHKDNLGYIWYSSHQGLSRLNPKTLHIENFTKEDGLISHEYNGGASTTMKDGRLIYGSMRGITIVEPTALITEEQQPKVVITKLSTQTGDELNIEGNLNQKQIDLSYKDLGIELHFSSMNFRDAHKMQYRYWLEGKQNIEFPAQSQNKVNFPQLSPGNYIFNVAAISPLNGRESKPAQLYIHIKPAPWLASWALTSYGLLVLLIIYIVISVRLRQQKVVKQAHLNVAKSEQRLQQALASVDSGVWEWQASNNEVYASKVQSVLGYSLIQPQLSQDQHLGLIHPDDLEDFKSAWQRFLQHPDAGFDFTYRLRHKNGDWLWFRVMGKAEIIAHNNKIQRVLGTFTNITETRATSEKARLFGEAFQQTRDWVVIMDNQQRLVAANQSFTTAFGSIEQYITTPRIHHLGISLSRRRYYTKLLKQLSIGQHWQGEEVVITPDGCKRPTLINVSVVGEQENKAFYVLVFTDITEQKLAEEELRYLANYDSLTGLPNRALLMDRIYHGIDHAKRANKSLALCFIDLDRFKQINDSLGHDIGDLLLKKVAQRLTQALRETDSVARLGGDEFVVLLEGYKSDDNISHIARKMLMIISEPMLLGTHSVGVSPSIGIAVYPQDAITGTELLKHADVAMYHAKAAGRNNFQFFTAEMNEKAHLQLARETQLRQAIQQNEFFNVYQPIIDINTRKAVGAEVLLRWQTADGMISPADFIPLAEELRLIIDMTKKLLDRALADLKSWHDQGHRVYLSVNLSTQHLEQPALAEHTRLLLDKHQLSAKYLCYEVTESALMRDHASAIKTMQALSDLGIKMALDDFGTGYSSLKYLKELPIDGIKIDRSFVKDIGIDVNDETIIDAILSMATSLGMYCIAEGVETEQQLAFFNKRNCALIQGFYFAKPMPCAELLQFLNDEHND
ncbi:EAL domain-containing protein [Rheinheimera sp. MMS21-TC3]|uniref:EAL domain-containing protein n=1 Tax=Rheinheimera sp. MMS21-TC3 TaxID=3072790 RepID=UPI0028C3BD8D|nr:EAL domain-containing protein [Rheinheimera sp. MMS21-TC3]WNO62047.1 EAL domain-containing protein [Rheinheimera sp. MMS21-TC3]